MSSHDLDDMGICRRCGEGITAVDLVDGERPCSATPDPRTERIRRFIAACNENHLAVQLAPDAIDHLLGRIKTLEGENAWLNTELSGALSSAADYSISNDLLTDVEEAARALVDARRYTIEESAARRNLSAALDALDGGEGE